MSASIDNNNKKRKLDVDDIDDIDDLINTKNDNNNNTDANVNVVDETMKLKMPLNRKVPSNVDFSILTLPTTVRPWVNVFAKLMDLITIEIVTENGQSILRVHTMDANMVCCVLGKIDIEIAKESKLKTKTFTVCAKSLASGLVHTAGSDIIIIEKLLDSNQICVEPFSSKDKNRRRRYIDLKVEDENTRKIPQMITPDDCDNMVTLSAEIFCREIPEMAGKKEGGMMTFKLFRRDYPHDRNPNMNTVVYLVTISGSGSDNELTWENEYYSVFSKNVSIGADGKKTIQSEPIKDDTYLMELIDTLPGQSEMNCEFEATYALKYITFFFQNLKSFERLEIPIYISNSYCNAKPLYIRIPMGGKNSSLEFVLSDIDINATDN